MKKTCVQKLLGGAAVVCVLLSLTGCPDPKNTNGVAVPRAAVDSVSTTDLQGNPWENVANSFTDAGKKEVTTEDDMKAYYKAYKTDPARVIAEGTLDTMESSAGTSPDSPARYASSSENHAVDLARVVTDYYQFKNTLKGHETDTLNIDEDLSADASLPGLTANANLKCNVNVVFDGDTDLNEGSESARGSWTANGSADGYASAEFNTKEMLGDDLSKMSGIRKMKANAEIHAKVQDVTCTIDASAENATASYQGDYGFSAALSYGVAYTNNEYTGKMVVDMFAESKGDVSGLAEALDYLFEERYADAMVAANGVVSAEVTITAYGKNDEVTWTKHFDSLEEWAEWEGAATK